LNLGHKFRKAAAEISLLVFVHFILLGYYYPTAQAQESLIITGFQVKTPEFRPYREMGQITFFLNQDASINVEIQDKEFNLVRSIVFMGNGVEGENVVTWDGRDEQGEFVKSGQYIFSITAQANNGSSAIISKDVAIDFKAPFGTEFKPHITEIEGKPKKPHVNEAPERMKITGSNITCTCISAIILLPFALMTLLEDILTKNTATHGHIVYYEKDYKGLAEANREIDEYNAEIEAEIAQRNKEIDEYNENVRDSIVIKMKLVNN
jgi:hypothetical protein